MAKVKVFDNFGKEVKDGSLICIVGEKNRLGFAKIVYEGIRFDCASVGADYSSNKTIMINDIGFATYINSDVKWVHKNHLLS